jgi:hypothetical protein
VPQQGGFLFGTENLRLFALHGSIQISGETTHRKRSAIGHYAYQYGGASSQNRAQPRMNAGLTGK